MDYENHPKQYLPPHTISVRFKVEVGVTRSNGQSPAPPLPTNETYNTANNSDSKFWGGDGEASTPSTESYSNHEWSW